MSEQSSIEGQVIIKTVGEILSGPNFKSNPSTPIKEIIGELFDILAAKLDDYKKKGVTK